MKALFASGVISNSDLGCAGLVLLFLIMEEVCPLGSRQISHVVLFSDNQPTVS